MPLYQTKTIASILEPVAQQVSKLIILHEEGEDGNAMPDLEVPVVAVSKAVANLVRVGRDTINNSQDMKMKSEMPKSLAGIEKAAESLSMASSSLKSDPYSQVGRDRLIEGSRGILQGTTAMLICFDASQVRKLCRDCKKVLDYLAISEVIETMEDLVQFVKDLSPCLSKVSHDVEGRQNDLLNPPQRESLGQHLEQIKTLAPILICSMKIFIQILNQEGTGTDEAIENRNYLAKRMHDEISEVMRILEESAQSDGSGRVNGVSGLNLSEMTFHEVTKKISQMLSSTVLDSQLNQQVIQQIVELGYKISEGFDGQIQNEIIDSCNELDRVNHQYGNNLNDPRARQTVTNTIQKLENTINEAVINRIIQDMADITSPLKQFTDAVLCQEAIARKKDLVEQKGTCLKQFSGRLSKTANIVAFANARNKQRSDSLLHLSSQVQNLTPQLVNAGTIKMTYPENKAADENFENLRKQYAAGVQTIRDFCDEAIDIKTFLKQTSEHIQASITTCEEGVRTKQSQIIVESTTLAARLSNRLLMALARESENSEDVNLKKQVNQSADKLKLVIAPFVESSKTMAISISDQGHYKRWKGASTNLLEMVREVQKLFSELNMYGMDFNRQEGIQIPVLIDQQPPPIPPPPVLEAQAPPRPPLPQELGAPPPPRPPLPDTDDEEGLFTSEPGSNRPIHMAAHGLYQEVKQWDHTDNEIIAAAKKIAYLMAHLSELIRGGKGTKRELIACAKALADASERITDLAKELARHCTDKKIRTNLLQVCEKIPTLGTQLRVLSTVKATMMGVNMDTEEDQEAMDMLVFNAQKLNQAVKETVRAAEAASIRVRSDAGFKLKWVRKQPWFQ
eukprot:TRINITY_DN6169_c0_g1_i1.p1 TRINITY_DN6169_c0_g1~~TRINITY_DN6169_c0_g1_i1.p1  ORF type:complete len:852 (-),score=220.34 TRINITY_DN6169_c0_g1_i1:197-2752(-)